MINLHERMLPTSVGVEPATSWSPVGRRIQLSHRGRLKGECYGLALLPSIICLGRLRIASKFFIQSLTTASGSRLFSSVVRALDFYPGGPGSNPTIGGKFFQLCFIPLLRLSCRKIMDTFLENDYQPFAAPEPCSRTKLYPMFFCFFFPF